MRILVTGVASPVAAYLARSYAEDGHQVIATYRARKPEGLGILDRIRLVQVDLADGPLKLEPVDIVIHAAARTSWTANPASEYIRSNVLATETVAAYSRVCRPSVFYLSSIAVYGLVEGAELLEDTPLNRPDIYGLTKYLGEKVLEESASDFATVTIRLPGVIGPGYFKPFIGRVLEKALANRPISIYNPHSKFNVVTDFADVRAFISHLLERPHAGYTAVNLAGSEPVRLREIVEMIINQVGSNSSLFEESSIRPPFFISTDRVTREFGFQPAATRAIVERYVSDNRRRLADSRR